jgi:hypothetical protein
MSSLSESDRAFFANQPQEPEPMPTSDHLVACDTYEENASVLWDGTDGQGHTYWACTLCGSTSHEVAFAGGAR